MTKPQITELATKIAWGILLVTFLFVVVILGVKLLTGTTSSTFEVTLKDSAVADVLVITSAPYGKEDWEVIRSIIGSVADSNADIGIINNEVGIALDEYSIESAVVSRQIQILILDSEL